MSRVEYRRSPAVSLLSMLALFAAVVLSSSAHAQVDEATLPRLMRERGFTPPEGFKALVLRIDGSEGALTTTSYDWEGTSDDRGDWWPGSTIKIFAAVAALERLHALGFSIRSLLTYHYAEDPVTMRMDQIVTQAIERSSNPAFDLLFSLVGYEEIHRDFLTAENGFSNTVLMRAYGPRFRDPETERASSRYSPAITIRRGNQTAELPERTGTTTFDCPEEGNCTTLRELAEVMRRIMLHEELPEAERYDLEPADLVVLREALDVAHNYAIAETFEQACNGFEVWHKPGFGLQWVSDVLYIRHRAARRRWIVAMAAEPDRRALDSASQTLGSILCRGF
jgi:hypothetical protein